MTLFYAGNTAMPTAAAATPVTTGTAIKTMLQVHAGRPAASDRSSGA
jgi:hypothetical protein